MAPPVVKGIYLPPEPPQTAGSQPTPATAPPPSAHKVRRMLINDTLGYYKGCGPGYTPEHAEWVIFLSVYMRMTLGNRVSEELPVYDASNNLIGTFSIALPSFKPMYCTDDGPPPSDPHIRHLVCPSARILIQENIAELLLMCWLLEEEDLHPDNLGIKANIDHEMKAYSITQALKGGRAVNDYSITPEYARKFPALPHMGYWPTKEEPIQRIPGVAIVHRSREYANRKEFLKLQNHPAVTAQTYLAVLKNLLVLDKGEEVFRKRLLLYLPTTSIDKRIPFLRKRLKELSNGFLSLPEFLAYIKDNPSIVNNAIQFFIDDNKSHAEEAARQRRALPSTNPYIELPPHNLELVKSNFLLVWQNCLLKTFLEVMHNAEELARELTPDRVRPARPVISAQELDLEQSQIIIEQSATVDNASDDSFTTPQQADIQLQMVHFCHDLYRHIVKFYDKKSGKLGDNLAFTDLINSFGREALDIKEKLSREMELLTREAPRAQEQFIARETAAEMREQITRWLESWEKIKMKLSYARECMSLLSSHCRLLEPDQALPVMAEGAPNTIPTAAEDLNLTEAVFVPPQPPIRDQMKCIANELCQWLEKLDRKVLKQIFDAQTFEYTPYAYSPMNLFRTRGTELDSYKREFDKMHSIDFVLKVLSSKTGSWNRDSSFNVRFLHALLSHMSHQYAADIADTNTAALGRLHYDREQMLKLATPLGKFGAISITELQTISVKIQEIQDEKHRHSEEQKQPKTAAIDMTDLNDSSLLRRSIGSLSSGLDSQISGNTRISAPTH
ncbi:MAG: hypothetical protein A3E84_02235 [Gammaproteobacteria bacterium RIFCSPHIGHO2_12_FULL_42_13]|nr:MAG: hypothetical protein A3E84_02235 [Gammaproteobacteria bacterium RIFCSPHIGHO2_12_FULL_42_13]